MKYGGLKGFSNPNLVILGSINSLRQITTCSNEYEVTVCKVGVQKLRSCSRREANTMAAAIIEGQNLLTGAA